MSEPTTDRTSEHLLRQVERLTAEAEQARAALATITRDRDALAESRTKIEAELNLTKAQPVQLQRELDALKGQIRTRDHRDAFSKAAVEAGVRPDAIGDLFTLSGYKAERDEIEPGAFNTILQSAKTERPFLFGGSSEGAKTPPGQGRGGAPQSGPTFSRDALRDPKFMFSAENRTAFAAAAREGRLTD